MTTAIALSEESRALAGAIADQIEAQGHYQGGPVPEGTPEYRKGGPCCLIASTPYQEANWDGVAQPLMRHIGAVTGLHGMIWNDRTPTAEVLDTLRRISRGEL